MSSCKGIQKLLFCAVGWMFCKMENLWNWIKCKKTQGFRECSLSGWKPLYFNTGWKMELVMKERFFLSNCNFISEIILQNEMFGLNVGQRQKWFFRQQNNRSVIQPFCLPFIKGIPKITQSYFYQDIQCKVVLKFFLSHSEQYLIKYMISEIFRSQFIWKTFIINYLRIWNQTFRRPMCFTKK